MLLARSNRVGIICQLKATTLSEHWEAFASTYCWQRSLSNTAQSGCVWGCDVVDTFASEVNFECRRKLGARCAKDVGSA